MATKVSEDHRELAAKCGDEFSRMMLNSLPRLAEAMKRGSASASFSVTAQFQSKKDETLEVELHARERIPLEPVTHKVTLVGGQLSLFSGEPAENAEDE